MAEIEKRRRAQPVYHEPIKYSIEDIGGQARFDEITTAITDWFVEFRHTKEPAADARMRIRYCMDGRKLDGNPWFTHWNSSFATRVRMLCRYDIDKMKPIRKAAEAQIERKRIRKEREIAKRHAPDPYMPTLTVQELGEKVKYGDMKFPVTEAERKHWEFLREGYLTQFPELRTINAQAELKLLLDLHIVHERYRLKLLAGIKIDERSMIDTTTLMMQMKKALGIAPDQLAKRVQAKTGSTIAEAVSKMGSYESWRELRDRFWVEELLVLWQMYMTPSPRPEDNGYQIDEVGLFGQTRCMTCACAECGHRNYAGLSITQIESYLKKKGALEVLGDDDEVLASPGGAVSVSEADLEDAASRVAQVDVEEVEDGSEPETGANPTD